MEQLDDPPPAVVREVEASLSEYVEQLWFALGKRFDMPMKVSDALRLPQMDFHGLTIIVEQWEGEHRHGAPRPLPAPYGYIMGTTSAEGRDEQMDCFLGGELPIAYVVDSYRLDGEFDEHKVMLGYATPKMAYDHFVTAYGPDFRQARAMTTMTVGQLKQWLATGDLTKPLQSFRSKPDAGERTTSAGS